MNKYIAKKLAIYHKFTKKELYDILKDALNNLPKEYWKKPNKVNKIFDNGYYFNRCRDWINYKVGENDNEFCSESVVIRVLECFGKYSKIQLPVKVKPDIKIQVSEEPKL